MRYDPGGGNGRPVPPGRAAENLRKQHEWGDITDTEYRAGRADAEAQLAGLPDNDKLVSFDRQREILLSMAENIERATPQQLQDLVAKLVELGRLQFTVPVEQWLGQALNPPVRLLPLSPEIAVGSTQLPGTFHRDPADQIIVATARLYDCPLVTLDRHILAYSHVRLAP